MPATRTNLIWIFGDQHRGQALSCMGDPNLQTPHLDRMAVEGFSSTCAVAGNPWCTPFRGSLITGKYPNHVCRQTPQLMDPSHRTIAHALGETGYDTAWFGKWHLDGWPEREGRSAFHIVPPERRGGFQTWIGYENNNSQWDCYVHGHEADGTDVPLYRLPTFETDALTDLFVDYLQGQAQRQQDNEQAPPFFAALSVQPPHDPYVAPADYMRRRNPQDIELAPNVPRVPWVEARARRDLAGYYAMIENLDDNVGRIREAIDQLGLRDNTLIMFFSDHGDCHGSHGCFRKSTPWEESIRIPMIIGGGVPFYGKRSGQHRVPINHVDIAPTTLGLCGVDVPVEMQGFNYAPMLDRRVDTPLPNQPDSAYLQHIVRKYHADNVDRTWRGVVTADGWKYVVIEHQPFLMSNLNDDPFETCNLALNYRFRMKRAELQDRLAQWIADTGDSFPLPEL